MFEKIAVSCFHPTAKSVMEENGIEHNIVYDYSKEKFNEIIDAALEAKLNVMLQQRSEKTITIWIDTKRFTQR